MKYKSGPFLRLVVKEPPKYAPPRSGKVSEVLMPKGIRVNRTNTELIIVRNWFKKSFLLYAIIGVIWLGSSIAYLISPLFEPTGFVPSEFHAIVTYPFILLDVTLTYYLLAGFLNRTVISLQAYKLKIRHGPLPWIGNLKMSTHLVEQLYCQRITHPQKNGYSFTYEVIVVLADGKTRKLVSGLPEQDQALYIEQEIEKYLQIKDRPVKGEM